MNNLNQLLQTLQIPANITSLISGFPFIEILWLLAIFSLGSVATYLLIKIILQYRGFKKTHVFLEVKPLKVTEQSPYSTEQLFALLHGLTKQTSLLYRLLNVNKNFSLEIVSSKDEGIRYLLRVPENDVELVKKSLLSYLPGISVKVSKDYLDDLSKFRRVTEFKFTNHFAFPLKKHEDLNKHDPIAYLTGNMTKLSDEELVSFQLVVSGLNKKFLPDIKRISQLIYSEKDLLKNINSQKMPFYKSVRVLAYLILQIALLPVGTMIFVLSGGNEGPFLNPGIDKPKSKTNNPYQTEIEQLVKNKLDQQLFKTSARLFVAGTDKTQVKKRERGFVSSLISLSGTSYQALVPALKFKFEKLQDFKYFLYKNRLQLPFSRLVLSLSEVSDLYHFPFTKTTKTEDLLKEYSKELPAPLSLKKVDDLDVVFAQNTYGGSITPIGLKQDERRRHVYILGATGTGKSTMLLSMIDQDMRNDKGIAVIDPHGDLIEQILHIIPENRIDDVVYFNPDDIEYPMGINLLELSKRLNEEDAIREKEFLAESIISLFHKIYTEKYSGPRMEYILRNTIHTAFTIPNATLFTVYKLLINTKYRKSVVKKLTDENLRDFWRYEFAKAGGYQKVKMISPITNKIGRFLFSPTAKRIIEQEKSTIDFDEIINEGKILLCNVSKGRIGEDNSEVFGVVIMAKLQLAALKRARVDMKDRKDFYLYVDEFQNFATPAFAQILSEARKYKLNAILAHQTTSQLEDKSLVNITLANTGTVICFRTANPEDEKLILPQFRPYIEPGEIASLPSYRFYMRLGALNPEEPFSGTTVPTNVDQNSGIANSVIGKSRKQYAIKYVKPKPIKTKQKSKKKTGKKTSKETFSMLP